MKAKLIVRIIAKLALFVALVAGGVYAYTLTRSPQIIQAVGDLNVIWGVPDGSPIFTIKGMVPGDSYVRTVTVENNASVVRSVTLRGLKTAETHHFASILEIIVSEGNTDLYGGSRGTKTLRQFFEDSLSPAGIPLSQVSPGSHTAYTIRVSFPASAGNEYQDAFVKFNIIFGIRQEIPDDCRYMNFSGTPIYGTAGNDRLNGTPGSDLIFALEGNDKVYGKGSDDCIIGGSGNDDLDGGEGDDFILGGDGNDRLTGVGGADILDGGSGNDDIRSGGGNDVVTAGSGNDQVRGDSGDDRITAGDGNDTVFAGDGNDTVYGGKGNDMLDGGNGNDILTGDDGNDALFGRSGNDTLTGGNQLDVANGGPGTDTCSAETKNLCE